VTAGDASGSNANNDGKRNGSHGALNNSVALRDQQPEE